VFVFTAPHTFKLLTHEAIQIIADYMHYDCVREVADFLRH